MEEQTQPKQLIPIKKPLRISINRRLLIIGGGIGILLLIIIVSILSKSELNKTNVPLPTPTPDIHSKNVQTSENYKRSIEKIDQQQKEFLNHESIVGQLLHKLPYTGRNFSLAYDYYTNTYTATISSSNTTQGNVELDQFLKTNGIENRSWIRKLVINYQ